MEMKNASRNLTAKQVAHRLRGLKWDIPLEPISLDMVNEFYLFLIGADLPEGMEITKSHRPKLTKEKAFTVIWFLQEHLRIVPDHYESCDNCGNLYDSHCSGYYSEKGVNGMYCFCGACEHLAPWDDRKNWT